MVMVFGFGKLHIIADMDGGWRTIGPFDEHELYSKDDLLSSQLYPIASRNSSVRFRLVVGLYFMGFSRCFSFFALVECWVSSLSYWISDALLITSSPVGVSGGNQSLSSHSAPTSDCQQNLRWIDRTQVHKGWDKIR